MTDENRFGQRIAVVGMIVGPMSSASFADIPKMVKIKTWKQTQQKPR